MDAMTARELPSRGGGVLDPVARGSGGELIGRRRRLPAVDPLELRRTVDGVLNAEV